MALGYSDGAGMDIRDDVPLADGLPLLLNFRCVRLPVALGEQSVTLDLGCNVFFEVVLAPPSPPLSPPPPPPFDLHGKLDSAKCDAMLRDPTHLFRKMWCAAVV